VNAESGHEGAAGLHNCWAPGCRGAQGFHDDAYGVTTRASPDGDDAQSSISITHFPFPSYLSLTLKLSCISDYFIVILQSMQIATHCLYVAVA
jgi:hypothetical protein